MGSQVSSKDTVGVIGAGSFGTAVANLLAENREVLLYARRPEVAKDLSESRSYKGRKLNEAVKLTNDLEEVAQKCELIFPIVPSENFREMLLKLAPFLYPYHILIHGTKGFSVNLAEGESLADLEILDKSQVKTMSELIREETVVRRIGCMAGPNIAYEIDAKEPAATVIASHFDEVIREGQAALRSPMFRVHGNHDIVGIELAGVLKNIMAIVAGIIDGLGFGANTRGLFVTRGLAEIVHIGTGLGANPRAFLGLAGIGDLVTTSTSSRSRNFIVGQRLAKGESLAEILDSMDEVAEGIKTVRIIRALANKHKFAAPITHALHRTLFEGMDIAKGVRLLMEFPFTEDVEFI
ncbi:MAG: NAD(P)H-dependent glycerol-3-phosphate dehydrogenase [Bacteroidia bacterium]|nr:NAD(P)H-dependent glycerol-3-phosphate dehydrogenase [Bacteroidia bacterium]